MNYIDSLNALIDKNGGYVTRREALQNNVTDYYFQQYIKEKSLRRISEGVYCLPSYPLDSYFILQSRYPKAIFSHLSALYLNGLTDRIPDYLEVSVPNGYRIRKQDFSDLIIHKERNIHCLESYNEKAKTMFSHSVLSYGLEKSIVEMIRKRDAYDAEIFLKALRRYIKSEKRNDSLLYEYARLRHMEKEVYDIMEVINDQQE